MPLKTFTCLQCNTPFESYYSRSKFCSDACRVKYFKHDKKGVQSRSQGQKKAAITKAAQAIEKICQECGNPFTASGQASKRHYCSDKCKQAAYRKRRANIN